MIDLTYTKKQRNKQRNKQTLRHTLIPKYVLNKTHTHEYFLFQEYSYLSLHLIWFALLYRWFQSTSTSQPFLLWWCYDTLMAWIDFHGKTVWTRLKEVLIILWTTTSHTTKCQVSSIHSRLTSAGSAKRMRTTIPFTHFVTCCCPLFLFFPILFPHLRLQGRNYSSQLCVLFQHSMHLLFNNRLCSNHLIQSILQLIDLHNAKE